MGTPSLLWIVIFLGVGVMACLMVYTLYMKKKLKRTVKEEVIIDVLIDSIMLAAGLFAFINLIWFGLTGMPYPTQTLEMVRALAALVGIAIIVYTIARYVIRLNKRIKG